ncbi:MAG TPA: Type 1 glutamine amidotransferase-like domain-containing protein [Micromonosporaceae bacterium]|nr:Type 1 glutamine amidotransferase-like domain-containing protein [Micromonosporaceae bacterium]
MAGPLALVGSGEYTDAMLEVDRSLLDGRPPRYVQIPTAAAPEGPARLRYWLNLGTRHAGKLGVEPVQLLVTDRAGADDPEIVARLAGAGLIYLSGGNPLFLADTLRDTLLAQAIEEAWRGGTALAGCSAGAMALSGWVPDIRHPTRPGRPGLGLLPQLRVIPHFDRFLGRMPNLLARPFMRERDGVVTVGIDEDTALVGGPERFTVHGRQSAWLLDAGQRKQIPAGSEVTFPLDGHS